MKNFNSILMASLLLGSAALVACGDDTADGSGGSPGSGGGSTATTGSPTSTTTSTGSPTSTSSGEGGDPGPTTSQGGAGGGTGGDGGQGGELPVFVFSDAAYEDYTQIDRHGAVEAGTAGILAEAGLGLNGEDLSVRDEYNASNPVEDIEFDWLPEIAQSVAFFRGLDGDLTTAGFTPATNDDTLAQAGPVLIPDTIKYDPEQPVGYPNGRALTDPVVDVTLAAALLQLGSDGPFGPQDLTTFVGVLNPTENDVEFSDSFPFLADPH